MTTVNNYLLSKMTTTEKIEHTELLLEFWRGVGDRKCIRQYETQLQKYKQELGE